MSAVGELDTIDMFPFQRDGCFWGSISVLFNWRLRALNRHQRSNIVVCLLFCLMFIWWNVIIAVCFPRSLDISWTWLDKMSGTLLHLAVVSYLIFIWILIYFCLPFTFLLDTSCFITWNKSRNNTGLYCVAQVINFYRSYFFLPQSFTHATNEAARYFTHHSVHAQTIPLRRRHCRSLVELISVWYLLVEPSVL